MGRRAETLTVVVPHLLSHCTVEETEAWVCTASAVRSMNSVLEGGAALAANPTCETCMPPALRTQGPKQAPGATHSCVLGSLALNLAPHLSWSGEQVDFPGPGISGGCPVRYTAWHLDSEPLLPWSDVFRE